MNDHLADGVDALRPFVPAKDFQASKRFYTDLGFEINPLGDKLAAIRLGRFGFLLQDYYVEAWAGNFMMHLLSRNLDEWWEHIRKLDLASRYGVREPVAPKLEPWGLRVAYVVDPSGVLWHFAQEG
jgi:catechol 2,3-dioxygenase-like lactoylglutathione lyase family enzyme